MRSYGAQAGGASPQYGGDAGDPLLDGWYGPDPTVAGENGSVATDEFWNGGWKRDANGNIKLEWIRFIKKVLTLRC